MTYVVSNLIGGPLCSGLATSISWTNPTSPTPSYTQIVRRTRAWPFDLTDNYDVVYKSSTSISGFIDTGVKAPITYLTASAAVGDTSLSVVSGTGIVSGNLIRIDTLSPLQGEVATVSTVIGNTINLLSPLKNAYNSGDRVGISSPLSPNTYYYYLALVTTDVTGATYDINDNSRTMALSIDILNSKDWLWANTPRVYKERDSKDASQAGGSGFLDQWFSVMGCWLDFMRGSFNAISLLSDPDKAPFTALTALNQQLGIDPEGFGYDYDIVRRPLVSLAYVYKRKGTCPGIIEAVRMFTKWDAQCVEFGTGTCSSKAGNLTTWDGISQLDTDLSTATTINVTSADGTATLTDTSKSWATSLYSQGQLRGGVGDICCVKDNTATTLTLRAPVAFTTLSHLATAGDTSIHLANTAGVFAGMTLQITSPTLTGGVYPAEIINANTVSTPGFNGVVALAQPLQNSYPLGSTVTISKSIIRTEYIGSTSSTAVLHVVTDPLANFVEGQWQGFSLKDSAGTVFTINDNTNTTISVFGNPVITATPYRIAKAYSGSTPNMKYTVHNGVYSTLFEPTLDMAERNTIFDPYNRLYSGGVMFGSFSQNDLGIYITTPVTVISGKVTTAAYSAGITVFNLDATQLAPIANALVGLWLNPNQNQEQMFQILSNTTTTITVNGDITSLAVPSQAYYVLSARDRSRFLRLSARLRKEFTDEETVPHVLFV